MKGHDFSIRVRGPQPLCQCKKCKYFWSFGRLGENQKAYGPDNPARGDEFMLSCAEVLMRKALK